MPPPTHPPTQPCVLLQARHEASSYSHVHGLVKQALGKVQGALQVGR
jgi:hypothetical protein